MNKAIWKAQQLAIGAVLAGAVVSCSADMPVAVDIPAVVVESRGAGGGGRLLSLQAFFDATDFGDARLYEARLRALFAEADDRGLLDEKTVVVLPEYVGTWLVVEGEGSFVTSLATVSEAMTALAMRTTTFIPDKLFSPTADGDAWALFTHKAPAMAAIYQRVMSSLADDYDVTLVAGSIILPAAAIVDGALTVTPGALLENVSVVFDHDGDAIAVSRKRFPTADEVGFVNDVDDVAVIDTPAGRLGVLVCADAWFPQSYARLQEKGAELLAVPTFHSGGAAIWNAPWGGYSGQKLPDDVDGDDVGVLTEATAWDKYALAGRASAAGIRAAVSAPLRGSLWDLGATGQAFLVDDDGFQRVTDLDAPGIFSLELAP